MSYLDVGGMTFAAVLLALPAVEAAAQTNSNTLNQLKRTDTQNTQAARSSNTTTTTTGGARGGFDKPATAAPPVQGNTAPKPSPVGQPVKTTGTNIGYKPASPPLHINPVPSPQLSSANTVSRSTTTATAPVVRSTTTATTSTTKKP